MQLSEFVKTVWVQTNDDLVVNGVKYGSVRYNNKTGYVQVYLGDRWTNAEKFNEANGEGKNCSKFDIEAIVKYLFNSSKTPRRQSGIPQSVVRIMPEEIPR